MESRSKSKKRIVYYDGSCPMCTALMGQISVSGEREQFVLKDIKTEPLPEGFTEAAVQKEIHVVIDGRTYKNAAAMMKILEAYPNWRWLAKLGDWPIIRNILPIGYYLISINRHSLWGPDSRWFWLKFFTTILMFIFAGWFLLGF